MRPYYTSSVMRLLENLLINLRGMQDTEESQTHLSMFDAINKRQYHNWVQAVLECCCILDEHDEQIVLLFALILIIWTINCQLSVRNTQISSNKLRSSNVKIKINI